MSHYYRTTRARETGLLVTVCHGDDEGLDTSDANGGAWYNICNEHGFLCAHQSLSLAKSFASCPSEWCEECAELVAERKRVDPLAVSISKFLGDHGVAGVSFDRNDANVLFPECPECGARPGQAHEPTCSA